MYLETHPEKKKKEELNNDLIREDAKKQAAISASVVEGDGIADVVDDYPDIVLFFIVIYRYLRRNYRKIKKQIKKAFEKQSDEEVMAILQRENEAFVLTHMGTQFEQLQYVEPIEATKIKEDEYEY